MARIFKDFPSNLAELQQIQYVKPKKSRRFSYEYCKWDDPKDVQRKHEAVVI